MRSSIQASSSFRSCMLLVAALAPFELATSLHAQSGGSSGNLVLRYEFNETNGTAVADSTGNYNLTLRGNNTGWGEGVFGGALHLNSSGLSSASAATGTGFASAINLTQYTITGWLRTEGAVAGTALTFLNSETGGNFRVTVGQNFTTYTQGRTVTSMDSSILSTPDQWTFFAITVDSASADAGVNWVNAIKTYVGTETSLDLTWVANKGLSGTNPDTTISGTALSGIDTIILGNGTGTNSGSYRALNVNGQLDDIRLYQGVLSAAELNAIRLSSIPEAGTSALIGGAAAFVWVATRRPRTVGR